MGFIQRAFRSVTDLFRPRWQPVEWRPKHTPMRPVLSGACDSVEMRLDDLVISVARATSSTLPHEVTVVIPRAEITKRYEEGRLAETRLVYSSITISHAPRFPPQEP